MARPSSREGCGIPKRPKPTVRVHILAAFAANTHLPQRPSTWPGGSSRYRVAIPNVVLSYLKNSGKPFCAMRKLLIKDMQKNCVGRQVPENRFEQCLRYNHIFYQTYSFLDSEFFSIDSDIHLNDQWTPIRLIHKFIRSYPGRTLSIPLSHPWASDAPRASPPFSLATSWFCQSTELGWTCWNQQKHLLVALIIINDHVFTWSCFLSKVFYFHIQFKTNKLQNVTNEASGLFCSQLSPRCWSSHRWCPSLPQSCTAFCMARTSVTWRQPLFFHGYNMLPVVDIKIYPQISTV